MTGPISVRYAVEDILSKMVLEQVVAQRKFHFQMTPMRETGGAGWMIKNASSLNRAASHVPLILLMDLDRCKCPPALIHKVFKGRSPAPKMLFRIAVREIEAWLMADREAFAKCIGVSSANLPNSTDDIVDPKHLLHSVVRKSARGKIKRKLLPVDDYASIGPEHNDFLGDFAKSRWSVKRAMQSSLSLRRCIDAFDRFQKTEIGT